LLNADLEQVRRILETDRYLDYISGDRSQPIEVDLYDRARMDADAAAAGFSVVSSVEIPAGPSFILHASRRLERVDDSLVELLGLATSNELGGPRLYLDLLLKQ
jgi:hypothetical protein